MSCYRRAARPPARAAEPAPEGAAALRRGRRLLGPATGKPTLVLDLDETLVHSEFDPTGRAEAVLRLPLTPQTAELRRDFDLDHVPCYLAVRAGARECLRALAPHYELVVWTASWPDYAGPVVAHLDPGGLVGRVLCRGDCRGDGTLCKDLDDLGRDLRRVVIVDNTAECFRRHPRNGIRVPDFTGRQDDVLPRLTEYLAALARGGLDLDRAQLPGEFR